MNKILLVLMLIGQNLELEYSNVVDELTISRGDYLFTLNNVFDRSGNIILEVTNGDLILPADLNDNGDFAVQISQQNEFILYWRGNFDTLKLKSIALSENHILTLDTLDILHLYEWDSLNSAFISNSNLNYSFSPIRIRDLVEVDNELIANIVSTQGQLFEIENNGNLINITPQTLIIYGQMKVYGDTLIFANSKASGDCIQFMKNNVVIDELNISSTSSLAAFGYFNGKFMGVTKSNIQIGSQNYV